MSIWKRFHAVGDVLHYPEGDPAPPPAPPADPPPAPPTNPPPPAPPADPPAPPSDPPVDPPAAPPAPPPPADPPVDPPVGAPETYELAVPENSGLDDSDVAAVTEMARAKGLTNEQAQAVVNELGDGLVAQRARFRTVLDAHPEVGGDQFAAAQENAQRALDRFLPADTPDGKALRAVMDKSGYGNYAPLMVLLARIGKSMGEDATLGTHAGGPGAQPKTLAQRIFPDLK